MSVAAIAFVLCFFVLLGVGSVCACQWVAGIKKEWIVYGYVVVMVMRFMLAVCMVATYAWWLAETPQQAKTFALVSVGCYMLMLIVTTLIIRKIPK